MGKEFEIEGNWNETDEGQMYTARAVLKNGRIVGTVNVIVPLTSGSFLKERFGDVGTDNIVKAADEIVVDIAKRMD